MWWTVKCKGECTSGCNHHVSSESTWVAETLVCVCVRVCPMTSGSEAEKKTVGWGRAQFDYRLYYVVITMCGLLERVKDRARSGMRELVGHALWQKANGQGRWKPLKLRSQGKTQRNCVNELKLIQIRRRISSLLECWGWLRKNNISFRTISVRLKKNKKKKRKINKEEA